MMVFEMRQEKEIKILTPLFLITDSWLQTHILYNPLGSSWRQTQLLRHEPAYCVPLYASLKLKPPLYFLQTLSLFFIQPSVGREGQDFGQQQSIESYRLKI